MVFFLRMIARLPLSWMQGLGALCGLLAYRLSADYRGKLRANLRQAGLPDDGTLARAVAAHTGRMLGEMPFVWFRPLRTVMGRVVTDDEAVMDAAAAEGRPVIYLTPHLGAFEMTARYCASRAPITVLFKPPKIAALTPVLKAGRDFPGMLSAPANLGGLRTLLRALRRGEAIGLLPDQVPTDGEGRWVPFFGRPAFTTTLPQRLAEQTDAVVVMVHGERLPAGRGWRFHARRLDGPATPEAVNQAMETMILRLPDQYLWGYNRYKVPAGVAGP